MSGYTPMQVTLKGLLKILNQAKDAGYITVSTSESASSGGAPVMFVKSLDDVPAGTPVDTIVVVRP